MTLVVTKSRTELAKSANECQDHVETHGMNMLHYAALAGEILRDAKMFLEHGEWGPWLERNVPRISVRTAQKYMKLAKSWQEIEPKAPSTALLGIDKALKMVAKPKPKAPSTALLSSPSKSDPPTEVTCSENRNRSEQPTEAPKPPPEHTEAEPESFFAEPPADASVATGEPVSAAETPKTITCPCCKGAGVIGDDEEQLAGILAAIDHLVDVPV